MNGTVFRIGYTICGVTMAKFAECHPESVIGTFWLPATAENYENVSSAWREYVLEDNQAQAILNDIENWEKDPDLYTHMIILLTGSSQDPGNYSFMAGLTRFLESERLLKVLAKYNIPAHTEVTYPNLFYDGTYKGRGYQIWDKLTLSDWNEYIRLALVSNHGHTILEKWWQRTSGKAS